MNTRALHLRSLARQNLRNPKFSTAAVLTIAALFVLSAFAQLSLQSYANSPGTTVMSGGVEEPYVIMQVASASNPNLVYQITGAQIVQKNSNGNEFKNYFYLYVNSGKTFPVNSSGTVTKATVSGIGTDDTYWNVQSPPSSGSTTFCGTAGQDLDTGATSNVLSEWQWADLNWNCGYNKLTYSGSYDGGGPTACYTYSNNQERNSVYMSIIDSSTNAIYTVSGAILLQQKVNGVESSTFIALVNSPHARMTVSGSKVCPEVANPSSTPSLRWYVRTPPVKGKIPGATITGNFGITGTLGEGITKAAENGNMIFEQFVDRAFQTGYIPNQGSPMDISILMSTDPVTGATAAWPG
jgi:hypothetical protein